MTWFCEREFVRGVTLTAGASTILFRRRLDGVDVGDDDGVDFVNGGTSESRRTGFADAAERNIEFTLSLSMARADVK